MCMVQLLVHAENYAKDLAVLLGLEGYSVVPCTTPDFSREGSIIADRRAVQLCPALLEYPDRVIVIAPSDNNFLSLLWQHKMKFVVFEKDPPATVLLAVLSTEMRNSGASPRRPEFLMIQ